MSPGPVPRLLTPVARLAEPMYRCAMARRNRRYDEGTDVTRVECPVIAVGNLSVGGSGKTPVCQWLLHDLVRRGRQPALILRGYRARPGEPSDEEAEYRDACPGVTIRADPDRVGAARALLASDNPPDCIVLDDAFEHRRIHRDLDIVLVDATRDTLADRCLPLGWLREPVASLARADAVLLTRTDLVDEADVAGQERGIAALTAAPVLRSIHAWTGLRCGEEELPVETLKGRDVVAAAAIGHPDALISQLERAGACVRATLVRRDHHAWGASDVEALSRLLSALEDPLVVTTAKDWVKWRRLDLGGLAARIVRPDMRIVFPAGHAALNDLIDAALQPRPAHSVG
ncbi:MAG: tetraacyldisaccharide 4'-kinase [Phycisphaerales bacterium]|nr:tetraacyldisaccharide 4'-kinase [Phycisphaerales bacterium]